MSESTWPYYEWVDKFVLRTSRQVRIIFEFTCKQKYFSGELQHRTSLWTICRAPHVNKNPQEFHQGCILAKTTSRKTNYPAHWSVPQTIVFRDVGPGRRKKDIQMRTRASRIPFRTTGAQYNVACARFWLTWNDRKKCLKINWHQFVLKLKILVSVCTIKF